MSVDVDGKLSLWRTIRSQQVVLSCPTILQRHKIRKTIVDVDIIHGTGYFGTSMNGQLDDVVFGALQRSYWIHRRSWTTNDVSMNSQKPDAILDSAR